MTTINRDDIIARYSKVDTSNVADVLDEMGYPDQGLAADFLPYVSGAEKIAGFAYTIRGQMTPYPLGGDAEKMKACQGLSPGDVSVWSGDGAGICYFGELIAIGMKERGCVGALVDGGIRDLRYLSQHGFPVFAKYRTPVQSIGRWKVNGYNIPVSVSGATRKDVTITPGDFILADEDGAIAIPAALIEPVLIRTEELTRREEDIRAEILGGLSLAEALKKYGHV
ncbi:MULTISPECIES: RraA family protein [unclassified Beijerinckia]|uniref:RraA family protein n=1 Tax=unclassified Beijerinckia TaxID=2638183 RepID=UPI0008966BA8|nr:MULTISPECIES: RraA family protein [unclassified Beijerinckia]MDH7799129.1 4-hydroxy-4-methyl-2-oxoglutarate aldolase [Beijerinckia sp. GAS462]SED94163.1 Regulator of RNase E activity RraA [Beijerinckia sp. 28-YEA-48]